MLRSAGAGLESFRRGVVESVVNSFEWLTQIMPHAVIDSAARIARTAQEKGKDLMDWAIEGYDERSQVIYTNERGYRITAVVVKKRLNDLKEFEYTIKVVPGTYFIGDMRGYDTTADGVVSDYFREQTLTVLHTSLRKGK